MVGCFVVVLVGYADQSWGGFVAFFWSQEVHCSVRRSIGWYLPRSGRRFGGEVVNYGEAVVVGFGLGRRLWSGMRCGSNACLPACLPWSTGQPAWIRPRLDWARALPVEAHVGVGVCTRKTLSLLPPSSPQQRSPLSYPLLASQVACLKCISSPTKSWKLLRGVGSIFPVVNCPPSRRLHICSRKHQTPAGFCWL